MLAPMLYCDPGLIEAQQKGSFAAYVRGVTKSALPLSFPFGHLERMPTMTPAERASLQNAMRDRYAVYYTELEVGSDDEDTEPVEAPPETEPSAPRERAAPARGPDDIDTDASSEW